MTEQSMHPLRSDRRGIQVNRRQAMNMIFSSAAALAAVNANAVAADNVYPAVSISVLDHSRPDKHGYISYTEVSTIADLDRCVPPAKFSALNALYRNDFRKALLAARSAC